MKLLFYVLAAVYVVNSLAYIAWVQPQPLGDEVLHMLDVHIYLDKGFGREALMLQGNESNVLCYWLWAAWSKIFGAHLLSYRLLGLFVMVCVFIVFDLLAQKNISIAEPIYTTACLLMGAMHAGLMAANMLTEPFSLLFFIVSVAALLRYSLQGSHMFLLLAIVSMSMAVLARFYQLALMATLALYLFIDFLSKPSPKLFTKYLCYFLLGTLPFLVLIYIWQGITPPIFYQRYPGLSTGVGINLKRPLVFTIYLGLWFGFWVLASGQWKCFVLSKRGIMGVLAASFLLIFLFWQKVYLWNHSLTSLDGTGPVHSISMFLRAKSPLFALVFDGLAAAFGLVSFIILLENVWRRFQFWPKTMEQKLYWLAAVYVFFYGLEQFFVGGNIAFFERYLLLVYPAVGILIFPDFIQKCPKNWRFAYICMMCLFSMANIWRFI